MNSIVGGEWSIAVEMMFYMMMPLLLRYVTSTERAFALLIASLLVAEYATRWLSHHPGLYAAFPIYISFWFPAQMPAFALGILAFFIGRKDLSFESAGLLCVAACVWIAMLYRGGEVAFLPHQDLYCMGFAALIVALAVRPMKVFVNRVSREVGKISFSVYLLHLFFMQQIFRIVVVPLGLSPWPGAAVLFAGTLVMALPLSYLTHRFIERPGVDFGNDLIRKLNHSRRRRLMAVRRPEAAEE